MPGTAFVPTKTVPATRGSIGTDARGTAPLGNQGNGIAIRAFEYGYDNTIGGTAAGASNTIADNGQDGVLVDTGTANAIRGDSIFANAALGIEMRNNGNHGQAAPSLSSATSDGSSTTITGILTGAPNTAFILEFFANLVCDPSGFGQGELFLGFVVVTTDGTGQASFTAVLGVGVNPSQFVTATATDPAGNTSAFSNCIAVESSAFVARAVPGTSDPGLARMPDGSQASSHDLAPAPSPLQVPRVPIVPGSALTPFASGFTAAVPSVGARSELSLEPVPHAVVGTAEFDPWSADDLDALARNLLGGP